VLAVLAYCVCCACYVVHKCVYCALLCSGEWYRIGNGNGSPPALRAFGACQLNHSLYNALG
jgi:hypothetical protein